MPSKFASNMSLDDYILYRMSFLILFKENPIGI